MATQMVSLAGLLQKPSCQKSTTTIITARNSNPKSHLQSSLNQYYDKQAKKSRFIHRNNSFYDEINTTYEVESVKLKSKRFGRLKKRRAAQKARELSQLGLWCVKATISYFLGKQKQTCQKFNATKTGVKKSQLQSFGYQQQHALSHFVDENRDFYDDDEKKRCRLKRRSRVRVQGREVPRLGLLFVTGSGSISHILRKTRAFYNEFCCDAYDEYESLRSRSQVMWVDPYFSMPVIPYTSSPTIFN